MERYCVLGSLVVVLVYMAIAEAKAANAPALQFMRRDATGTMGAEHSSIAKALVAGRGFADPFRDQTGPTAWMSPALPSVIAGLHLAFEDSYVVMRLLLLLQGACCFQLGWMLVRFSASEGFPLVGLVVFIFGISSNYYMLFQRVHDTALVMCATNLIWLHGCGMSKNLGRRYWSISWGLLGGFSALLNPAVAFAWGMLTLGYLIASVLYSYSNKVKVLSREHFGAAIAFVVAAVVVTPWIVRGRYVLGAWVPIKSNSGYELWQSQCRDDDGVLDAKTLIGHPWIEDNSERKEYARMGEIAFVASRREEAFKNIVNRPMSYLNKAFNRAVAASLRYSPVRLTEREDTGIVFYSIKQLAYPIPFLCLFLIPQVGGMSQKGRKGLRLAFYIWCVGIFPYLLVSYYDRYGLYFLGMRLLWCIPVVCFITRWVQRARGGSTETQSGIA